MSEQQGQEQQQDGQGTYVYGVVRAGTSLDELAEEEGMPPVALLEAGDLAAIVGDAPPDDQTATRDAVMAHSKVLAAAVRNAGVVPMRFGIVFPSDEAVRDELLEGRKDELISRLDKVDDKVQMTLKVYFREDAFLRELVESNPEIARLRKATRQGSEEQTYNDRVRLGELINNGLEQRREQLANELMETMKPHAVTSVTEGLEKDLMVLNAPFLVEQSRVSEFDSAVEDIAGDETELLHFKLLGPMPAYHFIDTEEPAWA